MHEVCPENNTEITDNCKFFLVKLSRAWFFFLLINMKMPTFVGVFIFRSREHFMLSWVEFKTNELSLKKSFITSKPGCRWQLLLYATVGVWHGRCLYRWYHCLSSPDWSSVWAICLKKLWLTDRHSVLWLQIPLDAGNTLPGSAK